MLKRKLLKKWANFTPTRQNLILGGAENLFWKNGLSLDKNDIGLWYRNWNSIRPDNGCGNYSTAI